MMINWSKYLSEFSRPCGEMGKPGQLEDATTTTCSPLV